MSALLTAPPPASTAPAGPRPWRCTREEFARLTAAGFFTERRYQLIRGEIIDMGKEGPRHFTTVALAAEVLRAALGSGFHVRQAGPLDLDDSVPEPDVAVVPGTARDYLTAHPTTALLAVEVAETSLAYDTTVKAELYATAGVPEYWVLDLNGRELIVFRDPQPLPTGLGATAYRSRAVFAPGQGVVPLRATAPVQVSDLLP